MDTLKDSAIDYLAPRHLVNKKTWFIRVLFGYLFAAMGEDAWRTLGNGHKPDSGGGISLKNHMLPWGKTAPIW